MQADEGVGIIPVAAGRGSPIHHDDLGIRLGDERVRERHSGRSAADDEIVCLQCASGHGPSSPFTTPELNPGRVLTAA